MHIGGAEFEARKRRKVDLISFDMVIKIKKILNLNVPRNTVISSTIIDNIMSANKFARFSMKNIRYSNISHRLTCMIAFINVDYI